MKTLLQSTFIALSCSAGFLTVSIPTSSVSASVTAPRDVFVGQKVAGRTPLQSIDHSDWDSLLQKYVDQNGQINYTGWHQSSTDRARLQQYLNSLSLGKPAGSSKAGQLAFWINAYNAITVQGILNVYPTSSIKKHTSKLGGYNIWKGLFLYVDGQKYSPDHIEHQILRKMNEPRIHFAIVCASIGCPRLLNNAYLPNTIDKQLQINAVDFFSRQQNFHYDAANRTIHLSALLNWFEADFGGSKAALLQTIQRWVADANARQALASGQVSVKYLDYDWNLNDQKSIRR